MSPKAGASKSSSASAAEASGKAPASRPARRPASYVRRAKTVKAVQVVRGIPNKVFPQWARTVLAVVIWLGTVPMYVSAVSPYVSYLSATVMTVGMGMFAGIAPHVWPSRTPPWRTVGWAWLVSMISGMTVLTMGWGRYAVTVATLVGFAIIIGRANQNARRLVRLFRTWRAMR